MAADNVETAEFIDGLDPTLPPRDGQRSNGDDHLRLTKGAIRRTFPNITGAVELTQADINGLPARVNALEGSAVRIPPAGGPVTVGGRQLIGVGYPIEGVPSQAPNIQWVADYVRLIVLNQIYPIGSILINGSGINPQTYIGGTWIAQGTGRVLVGVGAGTDSRGEARAFALGESGGEYNHVLTNAELPADNIANFSIADTGGAMGSGTKAINKTFGSGGAHNNMPPYLAVHIWQRTA